MATSSIFRDVHIDTRSQARKLANALERAERIAKNDQYKSPCSTNCRDMTPDELRAVAKTSK